MRLSISFTGMGPLAPTLATVDAAEANGLDGVWSAEHIGFHDGIVAGTLYAARTSRLEIGLVGLTATTRHPALTAMALTSLADVAPGRVRAAVGTGDPGLVAQVGAEIRAPARRTAQLVHALKGALAGRQLKTDFDQFRFDQFKLMAPAAVPVPVDVMAVRPRMLQTAAETADGVALSVGGSERYLRESVADIEKSLADAGRERSAFRITASCMAVIAQDLGAARNAVRPIMTLAEPSMVEHLARGVLEPGALTAAAARGGPLAASKCFTDEVIDAVALVAEPDGIGEALARYAATGIDELAVSLFAAPDAQPELVAMLAAARP